MYASMTDAYSQVITLRIPDPQSDATLSRCTRTSRLKNIWRRTRLHLKRPRTARPSEEPRRGNTAVPTMCTCHPTCVCASRGKNEERGTNSVYSAYNAGGTEASHDLRVGVFRLARCCDVVKVSSDDGDGRGHDANTM